MAFTEDSDGAHRYTATCSWEGSTGAGYRDYSRTHHVRSEPASATLELSNDPSLGGDAELLDPEQLVLAATASCQLLSFLAVAARARVDVRGYNDRAEARMSTDAPPRIASITLRPHITAVATTTERVQHWTEVAHRQCYVANSLATPVVVEPTVTILEPS